MEIFSDMKDWKNFDFLQQFEKAYEDISDSILSYSVLGKMEGDNVDKASIILLRCFIQKGDELLRGQKYVGGIRSINFGDMAIFDLVSLPEKNHSEIAYEHAKKMQYLIDPSQPADRLMATYNVPMMYAGGHVRITKDGQLFFFGTSGDYTKYLLGEDINNLGRFAAFACNIPVGGKVKESVNFLDNLLTLMLEQKLNKGFYERLIEYYVDKQFTPQQLGALVTMKSLDRSLSEGKGVIEMLVEEAVDPAGLAKFFLLIKAARKPRDGY